MSELDDIAVPPDLQVRLDEEAKVLDRAKVIYEEWLREHAGSSLELAPDPGSNNAVPQSGVVTPSLLRKYFLTRGVDVMVTYDKGKLYVEPRYPSDIGILVRQVKE